ncbi:MAG: MBL fold metallo-hydrolase [Clostridia bacterium]|nr:MBL fold metallo-hydrolase [Clostridia bacterium]
MTIETYALGPVQANCYIVWEDAAKGVVVIDPGDDADTLPLVLRGRKVAGVLVTHAHFDHILGLPALAGVPIYAHELDAAAMTDPARCAPFGGYFPAVPPTDTVRDGDVISLAGLSFTVLHTPGHTPGSVCYQCGNALFTGDTLFCPGYGRVDLPGGSWRDLVSSLRRLLEMDGSLHVYPGHGTDAPLSQVRASL